MHQPLVRGSAGLLLKAACEGPQRHGCSIRQIFDPKSFMQVGLGPLQNWSQASSHATPNWIAHVLRLSAVAMRWHDQPPRNFIGGFGAVVKTDDVQTEINACGASGRGQNTALIYVEHVGLNSNLRITLA
jgi:hypothetical protein